MEEMVRRLGKKSAKRETRESNAGDAVGVHDPTRAKAMPRVRPRVTATSYLITADLPLLALVHERRRKLEFSEVCSPPRGLTLFCNTMQYPIHKDARAAIQSDSRQW